MNYNIIKNLNKINKNILIILIILFIGFFTQISYIKAEDNNVIKVGYPIVEGFTEIKDGNHSGYAYEYLRQIAKFTGWEYEFVEMDLNEAMNALKDGEIDLLAGMIKNDQTMEIYDFPEYDIGSTYTTLITLNDNKNISSSNYETLDGIKVGYFETAKKSTANFIKFYESNDIKNIELISYPHKYEELLFDKLKDKEVDAIIQGDLLINSEEKVIAKFGETPYYLATTKGNKKIISDLNNAIFKIKEKNSNFDQELYNKYFESNNDYSFSLTDEEKEYIKNTTLLKAVYVDNYEPIQYYDNDTKKSKGIFIDIINLICEKSGLTFEFSKVNTYEEAYELLKNKEADLIIGMPSVFSIADKNEITLSSSYLSLDMVSVVREGSRVEEDKQIIALPKGYAHTESYVGQRIDIYDTVEECIEAVNEGNADITYGNEYCISYYISGGYYPNVRIISNGNEKDASIGLAKPTDKNLLSIINKAIYSIEDDQIQDIIYNNTMNTDHDVTFKEFFFENLDLCLLILILFLSTIGIMISIIIKLRFDKIKTTEEMLIRKTQIDSLTGIYNREACQRLVMEYLNNKESYIYGAFVIMDIDYFKQVNDNLGHKIGDKVLVDFAKLLKQFFSNMDIVSRLGGDEFIVFMKGIDENNLQKVDEKLQELCKIMNKEVEYNGKSQNISISVGAVVTRNNIAFEQLYQMADENLYKVKRNGRNGFKIKIYN